MNKELKSFIDDEFSNIYRSLNIEWKLGLRSKKEELLRKGLAHSGFEQSNLSDYAIELISKCNNSIKEFIEKNQEKFNFKMSNDEISVYIEKAKKNNTSYIDIFKKELEEYFKETQLPLIQSCNNKFANAKVNIDSSLDKIKRELILINKSSANHKEKKGLSKENIIGIISIAIAIIFGVLSFIF
ncbi:MAG: hypothetical protein PHN72_02165 [Bacilli bacterium]|nr:hypothetical protein [Bacilli bacterium]